MKILTKYIPTVQTLTVRSPGILESQIIQFIGNLHFAQAIDRAALGGGRIIWIGRDQ